MRLLIYILISFQVFYFYSAFAEKNKKKRSKSDEIKWQKLETNEEANSLKKLFGKNLMRRKVIFRMKI